MTMIERCMAAIRAKIAELRELLARADIPDDKAQEIRSSLDLMEQIVAQYE